MPYKYKEIEKRLFLLGFIINRQTGLHVIFDNGENIIPVPKHGNKEISIGIEKAIIKNLGLTNDEFKNIIKN